MALQDVEDLARLAHAGDFARRRALEVDDEAGVFLPGREHVHRAVEHEAEVVDLSVAHVGVLFGWVEVEAGAGGVVVGEDDLFARFVFRGDVVEGEGVGAVFAAPGEGGLQAFQRGGRVPFRGAQVAEQAFAG